jgi:hypothetical protein
MFRFILAISILLGLSLVLLAESALAKTTSQLQIGEEWSRIPYQGLTTNESLNTLIKGTGRIDLRDESGTALYLGKFQGKHLMVTNYHVFPNSSDCATGRVYFQSLNRSYRCLRVVSSLRNIELTFFTIRVSQSDEYKFQNMALKFDFVHEQKPGEKIVTTGHGISRNPGHKLTYEASSTCMVATSTQYPHFIQVKNSAGLFNAWSFVHACEVSQGDSGSGLMDEASGKLIGINWATSSNKPNMLLNSNAVLDWIDRQVAELWPSLSLGIPNSKILTSIQQQGNSMLMDFIRSNQ